MGRQHLPIANSAIMTPALFLLPILLCVAQADPKSDWYLIDTVDDQESDGRADDYFDRDMMMEMLKKLMENRGDNQCGSVICQNSNKNWNDYQSINNLLSQIGTQKQIEKQTQIGKNSVSGCCANNMNVGR